MKGVSFLSEKAKSHLSLTRKAFSRVWITTALLAGLAGQPLWAYSEDLCFAESDEGRSEPFNCWNMTCADENQEGTCVIDGVTNYLNATLLAAPDDPNRSSLHFDVVWILARLHALSAQEALELAVYSQAADRGYYQHVYSDGTPGLEVSIASVARNNNDSGGVWFHFPPRQGDPSQAQYSSDGRLDYQPGHQHAFPSEEQPLNHLRAWAFGQSHNLCNFGLSTNQGQCIAGNQINVSLSVFGPVWIPAPTTAGPVVVDPANPNSTTELTGSLGALGIYIHTLKDRVSHFACSQITFIDEPVLKRQAYSVDYPSSECGQINHGLGHYTETGTNHLPARTGLGLEYTYREIGQWLQAQGQSTGTAPAWADIQDGLLEAVAESAAADRLTALCQLAVEQWGLGWHDHNTDCDYLSPY